MSLDEANINMTAIAWADCLRSWKRFKRKPIPASMPPYVIGFTEQRQVHRSRCFQL